MQRKHFFLTFASSKSKTKGCPTRRAEIIPYEPDAVSTDEGIVILHHMLFSLPLCRNTLWITFNKTNSLYNALVPCTCMEQA